MSAALSDATSAATSATAAVYTGSFDPITLGHMHIIRRAAPLFERLIIGVGINAEKKSLFSPGERVDLIRRVTGPYRGVEIETFEGLAVDFVRSVDAKVMLRGIRPLTDIAGEFTMMMANQKLDPGIETLFLMSDDRHAHISSSLLKQIAALSHDDEQLAKFVPVEVIGPLRQRMRAVASTHNPQS